MITVSNLKKTFENVDALKGISFNIPQGVYSGLIDPSFRVIDPSAGGNNPEGRSLLSMQ